MKKVIIVTATIASSLCMIPSGVHAEEQAIEVTKDIPSFYNVEIPKKIEIGDNEDTTFSYSVNGNLAPKEVVTINASITDISRQNSADTYEATLNLSRNEFDEDYFDNPTSSETGIIHTNEIKKAGNYSATMTFNVEKRTVKALNTKNIGDTSSSITATLYENGLLELTGQGTLREVNYSDNFYGYSRNVNEVKKIAIRDKIKAPVNSSKLFYGFGNVTNIVGLENLDTSDVNNMTSMFGSLEKLESLDISSFNTSNVTNMDSLFHFDKSLTSLNLSGLDTSKVTNMRLMFSSCSSLNKLDLSNFNTSNVENMSSMFSSMRELNTLDLSNFSTSNVVDMSSMFSSCVNLSELNVENFDVSKVTNMNSMFYQCENLQILNIENWVVNLETNKLNMFLEVPAGLVPTWYHA